MNNLFSRNEQNILHEAKINQKTVAFGIEWLFFIGLGR